MKPASSSAYRAGYMALLKYNPTTWEGIHHRILPTKSPMTRECAIPPSTVAQHADTHLTSTCMRQLL